MGEGGYVTEVLFLLDGSEGLFFLLFLVNGKTSPDLPVIKLQFKTNGYPTKQIANTIKSIHQETITKSPWKEILRRMYILKSVLRGLGPLNVLNTGLYSNTNMVIFFLPNLKQCLFIYLNIRLSTSIFRKWCPCPVNLVLVNLLDGKWFNYSRHTCM